MSMSRYRTAPREGHLEKFKRIYGYLCRFWHFKLRFRVEEQHYSNVLEIPDHDWEHSVYGKYEENIAEDAPEPLGKRIILTHYFNASLMHKIYYLERLWLVYAPSTTRLLSTGIASSNLHLKQLPMLQSSYLEENIVRISSITEHISDTLESQLVK